MDIEEQTIEAIEFKLRPSDALQAPPTVMRMSIAIRERCGCRHGFASEDPRVR